MLFSWPPPLPPAYENWWNVYHLNGYRKEEGQRIYKMKVDMEKVPEMDHRRDGPLCALNILLKR